MRTVARPLGILACTAVLSVLFSIPSHDPEIETLLVLEVRSGERMKDLADRLEKMRLTTADDMAAVAASYAPDDFPALPRSRRDPARFEGLIRPGTYVFRLNALRASSRAGESEAFSAAHFILTRMLKESCHRYDLGAANGLSPHQQAILASMVEK
jgi:cell division protein YceG involved in septum cleavage